MPDLFRGRRPPLRDLEPPADVHVGLWLARFLSYQTWPRDRQPPGYSEDRARSARDVLIGQVEQKRLPDGYAHAFRRWRDGFDPDRVALAEATVRGRLVVGAGAKGAGEFGLTLHHTWGTPMIPGSSLKGVAARAADRYLDAEGWRARPDPARPRPDGPNAYDALFGDVEEAGAVIFHDAWLVPDGERSPVHRDVLTVHHPDYYQQDEEPSDTDSPIPVPFVSVTGRYLVAVELAPSLPASADRWLEAAWTALGLALDRDGVGAKTNAGYGRLTLSPWSETSLGRSSEDRRQREQEEEARAEVLARRAGMTPEERVRDVDTAALRRWLAGGGEPEILGLPADRDHVVAATLALVAAQAAKGIKSWMSPGWLGWMEEALASAQERKEPAGTEARTERRELAEGELDRILTRFTRRRGVEFDKAARALAAAGLDRAGLERSIERLEAEGAKPGHLKVLRDALQQIPEG